MSAFELLEYDVLDSTNEEARRLLTKRRPERPAVILAAAQTAGKGTRGRTWASPPDAGLYVSIIHPLFDLSVFDFRGEETRSGSGKEPMPLISLLTIAAGVACADILREMTGLSIRLKPINDLYVGDCKLGGILAESFFRDGRCRSLITGIGVNLRKDPRITEACLQDHRGNRPISLQECMPPQIFNQWRMDFLRRELALALANAVDHRYTVLAGGANAEILEAYAALTAPIESNPKAGLL